MKRPRDEHQHILEQLKVIAAGLGKTFAPFCEVVVHDLQHPKHALVHIENNLSGRKVGGPATELGLARIVDKSYPQVLSNYGNQFQDGRQVKSTSIGIKDSVGNYVAALCLNIDLTQFKGMENIMAQFNKLDLSGQASESLAPGNADTIRRYIDKYAALRASTPRSLTTDDRKALLKELKQHGYMAIRNASSVVADHLSISRATVYNHVRDAGL
jgi:predicted transcriptional regulator YheO